MNKFKIFQCLFILWGPYGFSQDCKTDTSRHVHYNMSQLYDNEKETFGDSCFSDMDVYVLSDKHLIQCIYRPDNRMHEFTILDCETKDDKIVYKAFYKNYYSRLEFSADKEYYTLVIGLGLTTLDLFPVQVKFKMRKS